MLSLSFALEKYVWGTLKAMYCKLYKISKIMSESNNDNFAFEKFWKGFEYTKFWKQMRQNAIKNQNE